MTRGLLGVVISGCVVLAGAAREPARPAARPGGPAAAARGGAATIDGTELVRAREMLTVVKRTIREHYHDPSFGGADLEALFEHARSRVARADSMDAVYAIIAQTLAALGDSHTYFIPPSPAADHDHGWEMRMIGDEGLVVTVDSGSDAAAQGLAPGDRVLRLEGEVPQRSTFRSMRQAYGVIPRRAVLSVTVSSPGGEPRDLTLRAKVVPREPVEITEDNAYGLRTAARQARLRTSRTAQAGGVRVWRLETFEMEPVEMDAAARKALDGATAVVLDLRGNGGGAVQALVELTRHFFSREVDVAYLKARRGLGRLVAAGRKQAYTGPLIVLTDSGTASAAEMFARIVQIERRGSVMGDRTAACVMLSQAHLASIPLVDGSLLYGVSVTDADIIMRDGRSLEGAGVMPDVVLVPTAGDLAAGRDPILAQAVGLLGGTLDPRDAARLIPHR